MTGEEIARELIHALSVQYSITSARLLAAMSDRASVNAVVMRTMKVVFPSLVDVGCFSHMLDLVGEKFRHPHLSEFFPWWIVYLATALRLAWCGGCKLAVQCQGFPPPGGGAVGRL